MDYPNIHQIFSPPECFSAMPPSISTNPATITVLTPWHHCSQGYDYLIMLFALIPTNPIQNQCKGGSQILQGSPFHFHLNSPSLTQLSVCHPLLVFLLSQGLTSIVSPIHCSCLYQKFQVMHPITHSYEPFFKFAIFVIRVCIYWSGCSGTVVLDVFLSHGF